ncbi:MAG TPA: hypothetical protein VE244_01205 [Nitrososphaeraceae archaeon]|nr:hypothetical protein [Nitrososphaeraceae archaeon]
METDGSRGNKEITMIIKLVSNDTITPTTSHQSQVPNISRRNNLVNQKMTPWKSSLLLSTQANHRNTL